MAKKIGAIVSLSIIGILILTTIIMASVNVNYSIDCAKPKDVCVIYNSNERVVDAETANKIVGFIDNASKEKALTALFNGNINKEATLVLESNAGKTIPSTSGFYVRYSYENQQKTKDAEGKEVYYENLVFTVNNLEGSNEVKVYLIPDATNAMVYTHYYNLEANFKALYDFLDAADYDV